MPYARPSVMSTPSDSRFPSSEPSSTQVSVHPHILPDAAWQHHLSTTFSQLSDQLREASHVLVSNSSPTPSSPGDGGMVVAAQLMEKLEEIEERQKNLEAEIKEIRDRVLAPRELPSAGIEDLLNAHIALYKLDQERLHGRLQNALATKSLSPLVMLPMKNGKFPPNSPNTRGEFEHLTKERYEGIMTCYEIPISGDTAAKRESLRAFLGIPSAPLERK